MELYKYQKEYLANFPTSGIMHADLGTGKTAMSLMHWQQQHKLLVVAPASKIRTGDWQEEVENWLGSRAILHEKQGDKIVRFKPNSIISTNDSNAYITKFTYPDITYISYEKLRLNDSKTCRPNWWQFVAKRNGGIVYDIIADECQCIKSPQAKQSKAVYEIYQSGGQFIGLSGTPMTNGWIDFAGYSKLFGFTKGITEFKQRFCNINTFAGFPRIVGYFNTEELNRQWHLISRQLTREQAHDLPSRQFIGKDIVLSAKDLKEYMNAKLLRTAKHGELLDNPSLLLNYLRQVGVSSRLDALSDVLDDTSENIVIFYNYVSERKAILAHIAKYHKDKKVLRYDGEKHDTLPKPDAELTNTVLVAHYKSASTGLNLQWATVTVFFSLTYSYQEFEQSIGRTHRTGQTKKCVFYIFRMKNTIDEDIYQALRGKKDFSTALWGSTIDS